MLLALWGLAPALHMHHVLEHHLVVHHGGETCSHSHHDEGAEAHDTESGVASSDACALCDWQWAPSSEEKAAAFVCCGEPHRVQVVLGRVCPALYDHLSNRDCSRRGPPRGIRTI